MVGCGEVIAAKVTCLVNMLIVIDMSRLSLRVLGYQYKKAHQAQHCVLKPCVVIQPNRKHTHIGQVKFHLTHYLRTVQPIRPPRVESSVVDVVVVAFRQDVQVPVLSTSTTSYLPNPPSTSAELSSRDERSE